MLLGLWKFLVWLSPFFCSRGLAHSAFGVRLSGFPFGSRVLFFGFFVRSAAARHRNHPHVPVLLVPCGLVTPSVTARMAKRHQKILRARGHSSAQESPARPCLVPCGPVAASVTARVAKRHQKILRARGHSSTQESPARPCLVPCGPVAASVTARMAKRHQKILRARGRSSAQESPTCPCLVQCGPVAANVITRVQHVFVGKVAVN